MASKAAAAKVAARRTQTRDPNPNTNFSLMSQI
jgi:hypothetical protein